MVSLIRNQGRELLRGQALSCRIQRQDKGVGSNAGQQHLSFSSLILAVSDSSAGRIAVRSNRKNDEDDCSYSRMREMRLWFFVFPTKSNGFSIADFNSRGLSPEPFQIVITSSLGRENMNDEIREIHEDPLRLLVSFYMSRRSSLFLELHFNLVTNSLILRG